MRRPVFDRLQEIQRMYTDEASQIETLELSFEKMREAGWDNDGDLLWGYFFVDKDISKLKG